nr:pitrilysin family protein [Caulobacter sp. SLTY]
MNLPAKILALALLAAVPSSVAIAPVAVAQVQAKPSAPPIKFRERTLPNGLKVISSVDRTTPNVTVQVWYGVGGKDDPEGRTGFAHLFEHLMFKATRDMPAETLDRMTEDVGGFNNAFTADDMTAYYEVAPAHHLERLLWAESQRLGSLVIDEAGFASERDVVKEELRSRVLSNPYGRFVSLLIPSASYSVHPYRRPVIGSIEDLDAATVDDVLNFHADYYRPDNAALIVVGNFDEAALDAWVDKYFGPIKTPATPLRRVTVEEPARTGAKTVTGYAPNVSLPAIAITWQAPRAAHPDAAPLMVLDAILSGGKSSRLYNSLVYDQQLAQTAFSTAELNAQPGLFYVGAIMAGGKTLDEGEKALMAEVAKVRAAPPTPAELAEAKSEMIAGAVRERETIEGRASVLGGALLLEGDADKANTGIAELEAVTAADVQRVAVKYLDPERMVVIRYLDESQRPAGQAEAAPPATAVPSRPFTGQRVTLRPEGEREKPPALGEPIAPVLPTASEKTLPNGLRVIVARSSDLPLVTVDLTVRAGSIFDPDGKAGLAGMAADLMTEGAGGKTATQIAAQTEALGADLSAGGGSEFTSVTLNVLSSNLDPAIGLMADVALRPAFEADELDRVRDQAIDGFQVSLSEPGSVAGYVVAPAVWAGTPFGDISTPTTLKALTRDDLAAFHKRWFRPDNAVLVIAGDITPERGFALAEKAFGAWKAPADRLPPAPPVTAASQPRIIIVDMPGAGQASVIVAKRAITRDDPRYYAGLVANNVLGGGYSSRLNQEIRIKRGLAYGAGSSLSVRKGSGGFSASTSTKNETAGEAADLLRAEMGRLGTTPPTADEMAARKSVLIGSFGRALATTDGLASTLGSLAAYGIDLGEIKVYTARIEAVTPEQVRAFAAQVLKPGETSVIVVGDGKLFGESLKKALPNAEVIHLSELDLDSPTLRKRK